MPRLELNHIHCHIVTTWYKTDTDIEQVDCSDGDIRLFNGSNPLEGRVEVCFNRAWGTICSNRFDEDDSTVICTQLSFPYSGQFIVIIISRCIYDSYI